jgi:hypothetical protein
MEVLSNEFTPLNRGDVGMPKVGDEYYSYDTKGKAAAKKARIALAKKKKKKKKTPKKRSA